MRNFKKIFFVSNYYRVKKLENFKNNVITYFNNIQRPDILAETVENKQAADARTKINTDMSFINSSIILAAINPVMFVQLPIIVGGQRENLNVITNIFNAYRFGFDSRDIVDKIECAIGVYKNDRLNSFLRTFNPLFWISLILDWFARLPFKLIGKLGFNEEKIESSKIGKIIKGLFYLIPIFTAFLTILEKIGYLNQFNIFIQNIFIMK